MVRLVRISQWRDFVERVGWTTIQAAAAAALVAISDPHMTWAVAGKTVGIAAGVAALKVVLAQHAGATEDGAAIPGGVIQTEKTTAR